MKLILDKLHLLLVSFLLLIMIVLIKIIFDPLPKEFYIEISDKELAFYEKEIFLSKKCIYINKAKQILLNYRIFLKDNNLTKQKIKKIKTYIEKCEKNL